PPEVLGKLLTLNDSVQIVQNTRSVALRNPHVPKSEKIAFVRTLCGFPKKEFRDGDEIRFAASDADTPPEVLECLAGEQDVRYSVAVNPHTPITVLEQLTRPDVDVSTRKAALENIAKHRAEKQ
ncbi:MAG TPA: hypothetical protein VFJ47_14970, partial [Terriglobales bacterium]|nr:hypothetical protein [Terriglobales bacterium]